MSEPEPNTRRSGHAARARRPSAWLVGVRYGIPAAMIIGGVVLALAGSSDQGIEGFAMAVGGGLSVLLLNILYRVGVTGEADREREEAARAYYGEHGRWPNEAEGTDAEDEPGR